MCISQSYVLRADLYHVMQDIWPKTFGLGLMEKMNKFLKGILLSETKQEWEKAYNNALTFVEYNPHKEINYVRYMRIIYIMPVII